MSENIKVQWNENRKKSSEAATTTKTSKTTKTTYYSSSSTFPRDEWYALGSVRVRIIEEQKQNIQSRAERDIAGKYESINTLVVFIPLRAEDAEDGEDITRTTYDSL